MRLNKVHHRFNENQSLSQRNILLKKRKKRNKLDKNEAECNATSSPPKKMKLSTPKKLTQDSAPTPVDSATPFVPYDYSQVDFTVYNPKPDDRKKSKGKRATSRLSKGRKMMAKTGARSVTYSSAKP